MVTFDVNNEPKWYPDRGTVDRANLTAAITDLGMETFDEFRRWAVRDRPGFWGDAIDRVGISFAGGRGRALDDSGGPEHAVWLPDARLNIAESCFKGPGHSRAVVVREGDVTTTISRDDLQDRVARFAAGLTDLGFSRGDRVAIAMPMTLESVVAYLGIVWIGGAVVSIADSFAVEEIATRLRITGAETVVTQDVVHRGGKTLPMYEKVRDAGAGRAIVVDTAARVPLRTEDVSWNDVLGESRRDTAVVCESPDYTNVLFSSGTTGEPKAIPWSQVTPIKAAVDGFYHQDIHPEDVVAWPTNLGWMMGPWLIYASLINGAALALYDDVPTAEGFGRFIEESGVTILGVVPSLVAAWRSSRCMEALDWSAIRLFSSTGEASNRSDMEYLMGLAGGKPVIEYCGGTEIGGGYIAGTVLQPAIPATFSSVALGIDARILDEEGKDTDNGELFLVPPSIGLSTVLLNRDHHDVYFAGTPTPDGMILRRHGDHFERLPNGYYRAQGRVDDTMNLGGIKVSSAEIERVVRSVDGVAETAAVATAPEGGGPSRLVVFAVAEESADPDPAQWRILMQRAIREHLNPLFKVHEVIVVDALPRTASAKVMRRALRERHPGSEGP